MRGSPTPRRAQTCLAMVVVLGLVLTGVFGDPTPVAEARSRVLVVAQDGTGDHGTIQSAVDRARAGDTILVRPGTYRELVTVGKDITIAGDGDRAEIIVEAVRPYSYRRPGAFDLTAGVATVTGLTIREAPLDLTRYGDDYTPDPLELAPERPTIRLSGGARVTLRNNDISGLARSSVQASGKGTRLWMSDNVMADAGGVFVGGAAAAQVEANEFSGPHSGVTVAGKGTRADVAENIFRGVSNAISVVSRAGGTIAGNDIEQPLIGIEIEGKGTAPTVRGNRVHDASEAGIIIWAGPNPTVQANEISGSSIGIRVDDEIRDEEPWDSVIAKGPTSPAILDNVLRDNGRGIAVGSGAAPRIVGNTIEGHEIAGIDISDPRSRPTIKRNVLRDNREAIHVHDEAEPKILSNDITERTARTPGTPGEDVVVAADGSADVLTIGEGVARARDGDRVLVRPGTYAEAIVVRKDILIEGDGDRDDIILEVSDRPDLRPAMLLEESQATLSGLTIRTGTPPGRSPPFSSDETWAAFEVRGGSPTLSDLSIEGETGLLITDRSTALVADNEFRVEGPVIAVSGGAKPRVEGNSMVSTGDVVEISGLLVSDRGTAPTVRGNEITGSIALGFGSAPILEANSIHGSVTTFGAGDGTIIRDNTIQVASEDDFTGVSSMDCTTSITGNEILGRMDIGILISTFSEVCPAGQPLVDGNVVRGTGVGIEIRDTPSALVSANELTVAGPGIVVTGELQGDRDESLPGPTIRDNVVRTGDEGIRVDDGLEPILQNNTISEGPGGRRYALGLLDAGGLAGAPWRGWSSGGTLVQGRSSHTATLLQDGSVLVVGGDQAGDEGFFIQPRDSVERYDPVSRVSTDAGKLKGPRHEHAAVLLDDGDVLILGGQDQNNRVLDRIERYDPDEQQVRAAGKLKPGRHELTATVLHDGRVLIVGGNAGYQSESVATAQIYDPSSGRITIVGPLEQARAGHTATRLEDGRVLIVGGLTSGIDCFSRPFRKACEGMDDDLPDFDQTEDIPMAAELFDPMSGSFTSIDGPRYWRNGHTATALADGRVLVAGGYGEQGPLASVEIFDPASGRFATAAELLQGRSEHTATRLDDGRVLVVGGEGDFESPTPGVVAEMYDPETDAWSAAGPFQTQRQGHAATLLGDGRVLLSGGWGGEGFLIYDPAAVSATPPASVIAESLVASFPTELDGLPLEVDSATGPDWARRLGSDCECDRSALGRMERFIDGAGATLDDVAIATARQARLPNEPAAIVALQVAGADAAALLEQALPLVLDDLIDAKLLDVEIGGKSVIAVTDDVIEDDSPRFAYASADTVWFVDAQEPQLSQIFAALP